MTRATIFKRYSKALAEVAQPGDAREESFYAPLADLMGQVAQATHRPDVQVTTQPRPTEAGNPDFRVWNGADRITGYIEAKSPTEGNLTGIESSEQLRRYRDTFPNLILTNFLEFRLYRNGQHVETVHAASPTILNDMGHPPPIERPDELWDLLDQFLDFSVPKAPNAEKLAVELAKRTRYLRGQVALQLAEERQAGAGPLTGYYEAFQTFLIADLDEDEFADLYAQTITYGLFAARARADGGFNRRAAFDRIPHTIGILRDLFRFISLGPLPPHLEWIVDDIAEVLAVADAQGILGRYYQEGKGRDPVVYFYETFLAEYDPEERERRGVYYTPEPVVSYIVRSVHALLKREFDKPDGLASDGVTLLDPAAGTMTFVAWAAQVAVAEFEANYGSGGREDFIRRHILPNFYGFELMVAPYAVGHLKMGFVLEELGHHLADDERVRFYLTNALDPEELPQTEMPFYHALSQEAHLAVEVKKQTPILVILGNPPYSGISCNTGDWITGLIEDYKYVDGEHFGERKHWLQDDYVKFLRFAEWKVEQEGRGMVAMVTNHGYLDNPTFRGMRQHLMLTFDEILVLDLHGSTLKRDISPDGSADQNVFDIKPGVAIVIMVKRGNSGTSGAVVRHAERWGACDSKYEWLSDHCATTTPWQQLQPDSPSYFFTPWDESGAEGYQSLPAVTDVFPMHVTGIVTARDRFVYDFDRAALLRRIGRFRDTRLTDRFIRESYQLKDTRGWKLPEKRRKLSRMDDWREHAVQCHYRPFDVRWLYSHPDMVDWGRPDVMPHMLHDNLALMTCRQLSRLPWAHAMVSDRPTDDSMVSNRTRERGYLFPLYRYPDLNGEHVFQRQPNLHPKLIPLLAQSYGREPTPEETFHYMYAVLYAPTYRETYAEFLRIDFPRVPFTADPDLFAEVAALGERLTALHLLRSRELDPPAARFEGDGDGCVAKTARQGFRYEPDEERVHINPTQHFAPVPQAVWEYRVGGYQVCEKWLKDRKDRRLDLDDIKTYCRIVTALGLTLGIQEELDTLYPEIEADLLNIELGS